MKALRTTTQSKPSYGGHYMTIALRGKQKSLNDNSKSIEARQNIAGPRLVDDSGIAQAKSKKGIDSYASLARVQHLHVSRHGD